MGAVATRPASKVDVLRDARCGYVVHACMLYIHACCTCRHAVHAGMLYMQLVLEPEGAVSEHAAYFVNVS